MSSIRFGSIMPMVSASALAVGLIACSSPPNAALQQAHTTYAAAAQDPKIIAAAPGDLQQAKSLLDSADAAAAGGDEAEASHRAYLASQRVALAGEQAHLRQTMEEIRAANAQRSQTVLAERDRELAQLKARQTPQGYVITVGNVLFQTGKAALAPGAQPTMDRLAAFLNKNPDQRVRIDGYTDSQGSENANLALSQRRADAVRAALVSRGVDSSRIATHGNGEASPVADNSTAEGRQMNRRVEILVSNKTSAQGASGSTAPVRSSGPSQ